MSSSLSLSAHTFALDVQPCNGYDSDVNHGFIRKKDHPSAAKLAMIDGNIVCAFMNGVKGYLRGFGSIPDAGAKERAGVQRLIEDLKRVEPFDPSSPGWSPARLRKLTRSVLDRLMMYKPAPSISWAWRRRGRTIRTVAIKWEPRRGPVEIIQKIMRLLETGYINQVRRCQGPDCRKWFFAVRPNPRYRFCSTKCRVDWHHNTKEGKESHKKSQDKYLNSDGYHHAPR